MYQASYFKIETRKDAYQNKTYIFDNFIEAAIDLKKEIGMEQDNVLQFDNIIELTQEILKREKIPNIEVSMNRSNVSSYCDFKARKITFSQAHANLQETAVHELAHYFDALFSVTKLPAHHIGFLSAFEYLLDKYDIVSKDFFEKLLIEFKNKFRKNLPFVKDYYQVTDIDEDSYLDELDNLFDDESVIPHLYNDYIVCPTDTLISKTVFEKNDHYINFIKIKDSNNDGIRFIKVIVKKLGFEMKARKKQKCMVISPKFNMYQNYSGSLTRTINTQNCFYSGIAISLLDDKLDATIIASLLEKSQPINKLTKDEYSIYIRQDNTIFIGFEYYDFCYYSPNKINDVIKQIKKVLKEKRLSYYHAKSIDDFSNATDNNCHIY